MADDTEQMNQTDEQLLQRQFTTVCEQLINIAQFALPFIVVLLDSADNVIGSKVVETSENAHELDVVDFVLSDGAADGLRYPMHLMIRDAQGQVAYGYLDDIDAQPEIQIVHHDEDE